MDQLTRQHFRETLLAHGYVIRDRDSFRHAQEIIKPFGELDLVIQWCKAECEQEWRWQMVSMANDTDPGRYIFYFDGDRDFFAFTMKWS